MLGSIDAATSALETSTQVATNIQPLAPALPYLPIRQNGIFRDFANLNRVQCIQVEFKLSRQDG